MQSNSLACTCVSVLLLTSVGWHLACKTILIDYIVHWRQTHRTIWNLRHTQYFRTEDIWQMDNLIQAFCLLLECFWNHLDGVAIIEQGGLFWSDVVVMQLKRRNRDFWQTRPLVYQWILLDKPARLRFSVFVNVNQNNYKYWDGDAV